MGERSAKPQSKPEAGHSPSTIGPSLGGHSSSSLLWTACVLATGFSGTDVPSHSDPIFHRTVSGTEEQVCVLRKVLSG